MIDGRGEWYGNCEGWCCLIVLSEEYVCGNCGKCPCAADWVVTVCDQGSLSDVGLCCDRCDKLLGSVQELWFGSTSHENHRQHASLVGG